MAWCFRHGMLRFWMTALASRVYAENDPTTTPTAQQPLNGYTVLAISVSATPARKGLIPNWARRSKPNRAARKYVKLMAIVSPAVQATTQPGIVGFSRGPRVEFNTWVELVGG